MAQRNVTALLTRCDAQWTEAVHWAPVRVRPASANGPTTRSEAAA
jgi:hypothetical protein